MTETMATQLIVFLIGQDQRWCFQYWIALLDSCFVKVKKEEPKPAKIAISEVILTITALLFIQSALKALIMAAILAN